MKPSCGLTYLFRRLPLATLLAWMGVAGLEMPVHAGGGPENLLLIVNPTDEGSLRIANAYVAARHIPINNIEYITPPNFKGYYTLSVGTDFTTLYQTPVLNYISSHGLGQQIDYISTLGQPYSCNNSGASLPSTLNQITQLKNGMLLGSVSTRSSELFQDHELFDNPISFTYVPGTNAAIHHSQVLPATGAVGAGQTTVQWYMSGSLGQWGFNGAPVAQTIQNLLRTVSGDGQKPQGTIYFEATGDTLRAGTRMPYWPVIENWLNNRGIPWIVDNPNGNNAPIGAKNVRGCELGSTGYNCPASTYLPGAWSDDLTSDGGAYGAINQEKSIDTLLAGNGGTSGTVGEPGADPTRFPVASIYAYSADGSTLGEAFYKSVLVPDLILFTGDLLSQAYADIPAVAFTTAPANGSTVSGTVSITASATLNNPTFATGISHLELFADGLDTGTTVSGGSGTMSWNSTQATDGIHELRVVAYNNSQAASEGFNLVNFVVNNSGESVSITGPGSYNVAWNAPLSIPVSATQGTGPAISSVQLQLLGLVLGTVSGSSGNVTFNASQIAYGANTITPVANLASGKQVFGAPITVTRQFHELTGRAVTPLNNQNYGFDFYYYPNAAGNTLATTNFSGKPSNVLHAATCQVTSVPLVYRGGASGSNKGLAIQIKGAFNITQAGEYSFTPTVSAGSYTSAAVLVDGVTVAGYDAWNGSAFVTFFGDGNQIDGTGSIYLLPGEHTLTVQLVQAMGVADASMAFTLYDRPTALTGDQPNTFIVGNSIPSFYSVRTKAGQ